MTAPDTKLFSVGLNAVRIYDLDDTTGRIGATSLTAYDGISVGGPTSLTYDMPSPESIPFPGNDTVLQRISLPSLDASSGMLEVSRQDMTTVALLNNLKVRTVGEANQLLWGTDKQGTEPSVGLLAYARGKLKSGLPGWSTYTFPKCNIIPKPKGMSREQQNVQYFIQPQVVSASLTGSTLTVSDDGATTAELIEYQSAYRMHFTAWSTTTSSATFTLGTSYPMVTTAGLTVYVDGNLQTSGAYTATTAAITFGSNVAASKNVTVLYELADTVVDVE
jgi:hypothetical protein